jgi:hypothetical protein
MLQDHDLISALNGSQAVSDDNGRPILHKAIHRSLDEVLCGWIQPRRSFVEYHQAWILEEDAGEGQQLLFSGR